MKPVSRQLAAAALAGPVVACGLLLAGLCVQADTLRLTSWNLGSSVPPAPPSNLVARAASVLRQLQPDIILLQGVHDWSTCAQLTEALKPAEFNIVLCSAFRAPADYSCQVAVLSRHKGYFSWSEPWQGLPATDPGGFGFVALQVDRYRLGFFSAGLNDLPLANAAPQLLHQLDSVRKWEVNQPQTFVVAGSAELRPGAAAEPGHTLESLENAGFINTLEQLALTNTQPKASAGEYLLVQTSAFPLKTQTMAVPGFAHYPVTCELEIDPARAGIAWKGWVEEKQAAALARLAQESAQAQRAASTGQVGSVAPAGGFRVAFSWWLAATMGGVLTLLPFSWLLARRRSAPRTTPALLPEQTGSASAYTVVLGPPPVTGAEAALAAGPIRPILQLEPPGATQTQSALWQQRALAAETQARQSRERLRRKLLPSLRRWLKEKLVRKLLADRATLLDAQAAATLKTAKVEQRLARVEHQIRLQNRVYEQRIEELTRELVSAKEENRQLIRNRIAEVKAEMAAAQARLRRQAQDHGG